MKRRWHEMSVAVLVIIVLLTAGCGEKKEDVQGDEPVTLTLGVSGGAAFSDEMLQKTVLEPTHKKYPHITIEVLRNAEGKLNQDYASWIAGGTIPDIIADANTWLMDLFLHELVMDITPLLKETKADIARFDPVLIDAVRSVSTEGWLVGLPYGQNLSALYYNQDIFDKFGVGYPPDGMTWDETIELAKQVGRKDGDIQYVGLQTGSPIRPAFPLSLAVIDPQTNQASVNNDQWKKVFELLQRVAELPGALNQSGAMIGQGDFWSKQNVAMMGNVNRFSSANESFTRWDVAQYPSYPERPDTYGMVDSWVMVVSKVSRHPVQAMQVINVVTSDEVQLTATKMGQMSTLLNPEMKLRFGEEMPQLKGKSIQSIFKSNPAPFPKFSRYNRQAQPLLVENLNKVIAGAMDINTALRDAEERINQLLKELLQP